MSWFDVPPPGPQPVASVSLGERIRDLARQYEGHTTGDGRPTEEGDPPLPLWRESWCSDFAMFIWGQAGAQTDGLDNGAASFLEAYAAAHPGTVHDTPQVGDAVVYGYDPKKSAPRADHVAIVTSLEDDGTMTVENGNWGGEVTRESGIPAHVNMPGNPAVNESKQTVTAFVSPVADPSKPQGAATLVKVTDYGVVHGPNQHLVAVADPSCVDSSGQCVVTGSDSVFVGPNNAPLARHGDRMADGGTINDETDEGVVAG